jgi:predicted O-methyltransferase YrrM
MDDLTQLQIAYRDEGSKRDQRERAVADAVLARSLTHALGASDKLAVVEAERARLQGDHSELDILDGPITVSSFTKRASKSTEWCRFLHTLTYRLAPSSVVEMGTGVGISGASIATALPQGSRMWTVDLREASARHARRLFDEVGVDVNVVTGRFTDVLAGVLEAAAPLDLLYVDGHHDEQATLAYTDQSIPFLSDRAVVVYDDIRWSEGMTRAWNEIRSQKRWLFTADLDELGICAM